MDKTIDIESSEVLNIASRYHNINSQIASMAAGCSKPSVPDFLDVGGEINSLMETVQTSEKEISNHVSTVNSLLNKTIETLKSNDDINIIDFFNLEDDFNFKVIDKYDGRKLTNDEKQSLIMSLCLASGVDSAGLGDLIRKNKNLSKEDKEYILEQLEKGNVRAGIGRMLCIQAQEDLEYLEKTNNKKIKNLNAEIEKLYNEKIALNEKWGYDWTTDAEKEKLEKRIKELTDKIKEIEDTVKSLQNEITSQRLTLNQYKASEKEWEYDYLLNKIGTKDFEKTLANNDDKDFYKDALEYYYSNYSTDQVMIYHGNEVFDYDDFYARVSVWLNSDDNGLSSETKNKYLDKLKTLTPTGNLPYDDYYAFYLAANDLANDKDFKNDKFNELYKDGKFNTFEGDTQLANANHYFDEDHLKVLQYLYNKGDAEEAKDYLSAFSDYFNKCNGLEQAKRIVDDIINSDNTSKALGDVSSFFNGTGLGIQGWFDNVENLFSKDGSMTESEYAQMYVNNMLGSIGLLAPATGSYQDLGLTEEDYNSLKSKYGDNLSYLDIMYDSGKIDSDKYQSIKKLKDTKNLDKFIANASSESALGKTHSEWLQTFFGAGVTTGNMVPAIAASYLTSGILSGSGVTSTVTISNASKIAGLGTMFIGCLAQSKNEELRNGRSTAQAWAYAILNGLSESTTEYLIGGIPGLSKLDNALKLLDTDSKMAIVGKMLLNTLVIEPGQEITEEMLQATVLDPVVNRIAFAEKSDSASTDELLEIALQTYLSTLGLGSVSNLSQTSNALMSDENIINFDINKILDELTSNNKTISLKGLMEGITSLFKSGTLAFADIINETTNDSLNPEGKVSNKTKNVVEDVIDFLNDKYNDDSGIKRLKKYLETGDSTYITRDGDCRDMITKLSKKELKEALLEYEESSKNNNGNHTIDEWEDYKEVDLASIASKALTAVSKGARDFYLAYGSVDQNALANVTKEQLKKIIDFAKEKYGLSQRDTKIIVNSVDKKHGACSYAAMLNTILELGKFNKEKFKAGFGYDMLTENGKVNDTMMLFDLFTFANGNTDSSSLLIVDENGKYRINSKYVIGKIGNKQLNTDYQEYMMITEMNSDLLERFLSDKKEYVVFADDDSRYVQSWFEIKSEQDIDYVRTVFSDDLDDGRPANMYIPKGGIMYNLKTGEIRTLSEAHAVTPYASMEDAVVTRSWNQEWYVPYAQDFDNGIALYINDYHKDSKGKIIYAYDENLPLDLDVEY